MEGLTSWGHMVMDLSRNTQHQVHLSQ